MPEFADAQPYTVPEFYLGIPLYIAIVGAVTIPVLSDRYGRTPALHVSLLGLVAGYLVAGFAPSLTAFVLGLFVAGLFSGSLLAMLYVLPGELRDVDGAHVGTMAGVMLSLGVPSVVAGEADMAQLNSPSVFGTLLPLASREWPVGVLHPGRVALALGVPRHRSPGLSP